MIRLPRSAFYDRASASLARASRALATAEQQATTGLRLDRPSDAPALVREADRVRAAAADQEQWVDNADAAVAVLDTLDGALGTATDLVTRARALAVAGASETLDADGRAALAAEVVSLREAMVAAANTDYAGRHVFAGTAWDAAPFDDAGTYAGATSLPGARVGADRWVRTGLDGSAVFTGAVDVFATLDTLADALSADDPAAVSATLDSLDAAADVLIAARTDVGAWTEAAEDAAEVAGALGTVLGARLSALVEVDPAEAYVRLTELRGSYEATLQVAGSASSLSLLDLLA